MKKYYFLIIVALILGLVLAGCSLLSNISQVPTTGQSGITYLTKHTEGHPSTIDLIADGGDPASEIDVGDVLVWNDGSKLYVQYAVTDPWCLTETHLAVANYDELEDIPQKNGNPIPGKFPYQCCYNETEGEWLFVKKPDTLYGTCDAADPNLTDPCLSTITYTIPLNGWEAETQLSIAAHAVLQDLNNPIYEDGTDPPVIIGYETETAWADGTDFDGKNWATYFTYTVQQLPEYGLVLWLDALAITSLGDGCSVSEWADRSVNGNNATQGTSDKQPTYVMNGLNGLPVVRFDGSNDFLITENVSLGNSISVFAVVKAEDKMSGDPHDWKYNQGIVTQYKDGRYILDINSTATGFQFYDGSWIKAYADATNWQLYGAIREYGLTNRLYINGAKVASQSTSVGTPGSTNPIKIGFSGDYSRYLKGDIAEILVYSRALSDSEREMVETYLKAKYDIL